MKEFLGDDDDVVESDDDEEQPPAGYEEVLQSTTGWLDIDPAQLHVRIPNLTVKHIHDYFIRRRIKKEHVTATKPFEKGYRIFDAKKVRSLSIHPVEDNSIYCVIRAAVLPTQRKDRTYETFVAIYNTTSSVYYASCTCVAGQSGSCNHVAALLFAIDDYNRQLSTHANYGAPSCTSQPAKWGVPPKKRQSSVPIQVKDMHIVKPTLHQPPRSLPQAQRPTIQPPVTAQRISNLITELEKAGCGDLMICKTWPQQSTQELL